MYSQPKKSFNQLIYKNRKTYSYFYIFLSNVYENTLERKKMDYIFFISETRSAKTLLASPNNIDVLAL